MPGRSRPGRSSGGSLGQHFLASDALATRLAREADIVASDVVIDVGAGYGALTAAAAGRGARVFSLEIDPALAAGLTGRFATSSSVTVFECDGLEFPLPSTPFRVLANPPFHRTAALLHRLLDDPTRGMVRADVVVQWQVARARAQAGEQRPLDLAGAQWGPWWCFRRGRRLPAALFRPSPSVDAAVLTITRRRPALLPAADAPRYAEFVRRRFATTPAPRRVDDWVRRF